MAHFAKLGVDNIVTDIVHVDTIDNMTSGGIEKEEIGIAHLTKHHGHENWRQCSYNTLRGQHLDGKTPLGLIILVLVGIMIVQMIYFMNQDPPTRMVNLVHHGH